MATFISNSPADTEQIGRELAAQLRPGSILALRGELGAGKTQLVKGVVAGLGSEAVVTSPTFTLVHEYSGARLPVYHFDFFRIQDRQSLERLGLEEYFYGDGVSIVEWADRFEGIIPESAQWISFEINSDTVRTIITFDSK